MSCNCGENNCTKNSRRDFLLTGLLATAAVAGCSDKKNPFTPEDEVALTGEKVKLLSVNGEVIEIDKAFLKPVPNMPSLSNSSFASVSDGSSEPKIILNGQIISQSKKRVL